MHNVIWIPLVKRMKPNFYMNVITYRQLKRKRSWLISITKTKLGSLSSIDVYMLTLGSLCIYEYHTDIDICLQSIV